MSNAKPNSLGVASGTIVDTAPAAEAGAVPAEVESIQSGFQQLYKEPRSVTEIVINGFTVRSFS